MTLMSWFFLVHQKHTAKQMYSDSNDYHELVLFSISKTYNATSVVWFKWLLWAGSLSESNTYSANRVVWFKWLLWAGSLKGIKMIWWWGNKHPILTFWSYLIWMGLSLKTLSLSCSLEPFTLSSSPFLCNLCLAPISNSTWNNALQKC